MYVFPLPSTFITMKHLLPFLLVIVLLSCSKDNEPELPIAIDKPATALKYDKTYQFHLTQGNSAVDPTKFTWTSADNNVGTIDANGLFKAKRIGETSVTASSKEKILSLKSSVTVLPYSTAWVEPVYTFNINKASVKLQEKRTLFDEKANFLGYFGESNNVRTVIYTFESDKLQSVTVFLQNTTAMVDEAATFLKERYEYKGTLNSVYFFTETSKNLVIAISVDPTSGLNVLYYPINKGGRMAVPELQSNQLDLSILKKALSKAIF